jgi:hypothetical protein
VQPVLPVAITIGGQTTDVAAALAPGFAGLLQVNVRIPSQIPTGPATLTLSAGGITHNASGKSLRRSQSVTIAVKCLYHDAGRKSAYNEIVLQETEGKLRSRFSQYLHLLEAALYIAVGIVLSAAAIAVLFDATRILWRGIANRTLVGYGLQVLDQLLFVLVLVEILHTVRISIRAQEILIEPFLIVGLIASIRRVLVITMQAAKLTEEGHGSTDTVLAFHNSMIELGLLGILVLVFVLSIYLLRRASQREKLVEG